MNNDPDKGYLRFGLFGPRFTGLARQAASEDYQLHNS